MSIKPKQPKIKAIIQIDKGETIAGVWATPQIPQIGVYKLLAKRRADGIYEWAHLLQRTDGSKKELYRGEVESEERLKDVVAGISTTLTNIFGSLAQLKIGNPEFYSLDGKRLDDTVH